MRNRATFLQQTFRLFLSRNIFYKLVVFQVQGPATKIWDPKLFDGILGQKSGKLSGTIPDLAIDMNIEF